MSKIYIYDGATGLETMRDKTAEEMVIEKEDALANVESHLLKEKSEKAKLLALTKLVELGLTTDDLKALGL